MAPQQSTPPGMPRESSRELMMLVIAMTIRNSLEDFHVRYLTDAQMAELNPIIRRAVLGALIVLEESGANPAAARGVSYLLEMVPNYWEMPDEEEVAREMGIRGTHEDYDTAA